MDLNESSITEADNTTDFLDFGSDDLASIDDEHPHPVSTSTCSFTPDKEICSLIAGESDDVVLTLHILVAGANMSNLLLLQPASRNWRDIPNSWPPTSCVRIGAVTGTCTFTSSEADFKSIREAFTNQGIPISGFVSDVPHNYQYLCLGEKETQKPSRSLQPESTFSEGVVVACKFRPMNASSHALPKTEQSSNFLRCKSIDPDPRISLTPRVPCFLCF